MRPPRRLRDSQVSPTRAPLRRCLEDPTAVGAPRRAARREVRAPRCARGRVAHGTRRGVPSGSSESGARLPTSEAQRRRSGDARPRAHRWAPWSRPSSHRVQERAEVRPFARVTRRLPPAQAWSAARSARYAVSKRGEAYCIIICTAGVASARALASTDVVSALPRVAPRQKTRPALATAVRALHAAAQGGHAGAVPRVVVLAMSSSRR